MRTSLLPPPAVRTQVRRAAPVVAAVLLGTSVLAAAPARSLSHAPVPANLVRVVTSTPETKVHSACPAEMAQVGRSCVDRWEATLVDIDENGRESAHSPFEAPNGKHVRAVSRPGVTPQAHVSRDEAKKACAASHKRLCRATEWKNACKGPEHTRYPYGKTRQPGVCVDTNRVSPVSRLHNNEHSTKTMNDPRLNQVPGTVAHTGEAEQCTNAYGVHDMVGNLHEWTDDGTFRGGYYLDTEQNGEGCDYKTSAHASWYYDYSTGFRCCSDAE